MALNIDAVERSHPHCLVLHENEGKNQDIFFKQTCNKRCMAFIKWAPSGKC